MFDYEDILDILEDSGHCVLFIGPQLLKNETNQTLEKSLHEYLEVQKDDHQLIRAFYEDDGLFLLKEENYRRRLVRQMRKFWQQPHPKADSLLQKLAQLPFPMIVSLNPDNLLQRAFDEKKQNFRSDFYFRQKPYNPFVKPTKEQPFLYKMLGDLDQSDSLVLTHKDLFSYLESVFAGKSMSPDLRKYIQDAHTFIFVGLPFEKWYMQLLLRVLYHISAKLEKLEQYASLPETETIHGIFEDEFKIKFVPSGGEEFIEKLYDLCEKEGKLKPVPKENQRTRYRRLLQESQDKLRADRIVEGIDILQDILTAHLPMSEGLNNDLNLQSQLYTKLNRKSINGMALESDKVQMNQTIYRITTLVSDTQKLLEL